MMMAVLTGEVRMRVRMMMVIAARVRMRAVRVLVCSVVRRRRWLAARGRLGSGRPLDGVARRWRAVGVGTAAEQCREADGPHRPDRDRRPRRARHGFFFGGAAAIFLLSSA